ncbi:carboxypeptidase-like regulatory domain-containing protein [uncultured Winogradskyella sp.]|uniref:carboxypeptidase-like regulatory domain-containing protein n=1 Tax=uncultured Winogradskyella sp. TaxID=395353 RepID=UPI00262B8CC6|nr:carboxypeptidase-like regulatory domain-containing protein [uncultured Winogradskyella sp.]
MSILSYAQAEKEILCRILDKETGFPVAYATIQIENKSFGLIANADGDFRIPLSYKKEEYVLIISSIGYKTLKVELKTLLINKENIISLIPKIELLDQVVINASKTNGDKFMPPREIVKKAIERIPTNYPTNSYSTVGYYRDYQLITNRYYNLNEAIIESFDAGFQTDIMMDSKNKNVLYSYLENRDFPRDSTLLQPYDGNKKYIDSNTKLSGQGGNELGILNIHNPIRNYEQLSFSFVYVFKRKFLDNHEITNIKKVYLNDEVIYEINFIAKESLTKASHRAKGKIYISKEDFAIHKFNYAVYEKASLNPLFEVAIEYKKKNDLMYLNYITFNNQFVVNDAFKFDLDGVDFNLNEKAFYVKFNNEIDTATLDKKDFKFRFNKKKLLVETIELIDSVTVKAKIKAWSLPNVDEKTDMSQFTHRIKNIYDVSKRKLFKAPEIKGFQYREYFVQEVFVDKKIPYDIPTINNYSPLSEAEKVNNKDESTYWLNTPLKSK